MIQAFDLMLDDEECQRFMIASLIRTVQKALFVLPNEPKTVATR